LTDVVLFHHTQGLTPGVQRFADDLGRPGHRVTVPDLFEGKTFTTLEAGMSYVEEVGFGTILPSYDLAAASLLKDRALDFLNGCS
jgi:dienelactone hydrolase